MRKILTLLTIICFGVAANAQQSIQVRPTNPEYLNYIQKKNAGQITTETADGYLLGERPSPLKRNFNNLQVNTPKGIPAAYDLRTVDGGAYVTPVKDQGLEGACWAFATYAAIESYWKKQGLATFDLSEQNLATCHGFDWTPDEGGNYDLSTAYLSRRSGPISEADDPYTLPSNPSCVTGLTPVAYVAEARFLPGIDDAGYNSNIIKQAIMDNGVIYCNMNFDSDYMNYSDETYCYDGSDGTNHGVAIVGWDNNKVVTGGSLSPSTSPGAWIIKNSWGPSWGESGYFYISYEDTEALSTVAYFPSHIDYNSSSEVYHYDELGSTSGVGYGDGDDYGLVKYVASGNQQITMLGSYINDAGTSITIEVYDDFSGGVLSGLLGSTGVQTCTYPGYYTYELATPINISSGNDFYLKARYNTLGETHVIPIEYAWPDYSSGMVMETGNCWISGSGGSWTAVGGTTGSDYDLCIKAYAVDVATAAPVANFTSDVTVASVGQTVYFADASSGIPDDWSWTFEGGTPGTSSATNPTVTWDTPGTYDVTLYVSNSQGNDEITITDYITITSAPTTCEYIDNIDDTDNYPIFYTAGNGYLTGPNDYAFEEFAEYFDFHVNNLVTGVKLGVKDVDDLTGSGYITVKIWDENGGLPDNELYTENFDLADFTPSAYNELTFASSTTVPEEFFIGYQIYYTTPQDTFNVYQVEDRGTGSSLPSTAYVKYSGTWGNTDDVFTGGFNTSFSIYPYICPSPPTAEFTADVTSGCDNLTVQFTDQSSANTDSWHWNFGDLQTSTEQNPEHTYSSPGTYTVTLTATNSIGSDVMEKIAYIVVGATPTAVTVSGGGTQCGGTMTLNASGGTGGTIYWQNMTSGGTSTATASSSQVVSTSGTYYFRSQSPEGCWGNEGSAVVTINEIPDPVTVTGGGTQCGGTIILTANGGDGGTVYFQNTTSDGTSTATASTSEVISTSGTYYFRAQSPEGCWGDEGSAAVTINEIPAPVSVTCAGAQCGGTLDLTATGGTGGTIYYQGTNSGGTSTTNPTTYVEVSETGEYYFRSMSAEGCWGSEGSATATIYEVPTDVIVSGGGTQCGGTLTITATGGVGGTMYYQENITDGTSTLYPSTEEDISVSGTYYFRSLSPEGCWSNEGSADVTIHPELSVTMSSTNESAPGANDGSVTFNFVGGTPNFFYDFASLYSETTSATTHIFPDLAGGTYCVTVIDDNGCEVTDCETVNTDGAAPVAGIDADVTEGCDNLTVSFYDNSANDPTSWLWNFGDGSPASSDQDPVHEYTSPGVYSVTLEATNATGSDDITMNDYIVVGETPTIDYTVTPASGELVADGGISASVSGGAEPYVIVWDHDAMETSLDLTGMLPDTYYLTVTEDNGCSDSETIIVNWVNYIKEISNELSIYPNPTDGQLNVVMGNANIDNITIVNVLGEVVYQANSQSNEVKIDVSSFAVGTYFIRLNYDGQSVVRKFVKQ